VNFFWQYFFWRGVLLRDIITEQYIYTKEPQERPNNVITKLVQDGLLFRIPGKGTFVCAVERLRLIKEAPFSVHISYVPAARCPNLRRKN
jgi:hypothetical protein